MTDMQILDEIRQLEVAIPKLQAKAKESAKAYKAACAPLKPARDNLKADKAALKAAKARHHELCSPEGEA